MAVNPILARQNQGRIGQLAGAANQLRGILNVLKTAQNPQNALQAAAMQNPQIRQAMEIAAQYNGDYNAAFRGICEQNGINPDDVMKALNGIV